MAGSCCELLCVVCCVLCVVVVVVVAVSDACSEMECVCPQTIEVVWQDSTPRRSPKNAALRGEKSVITTAASSSTPSTELQISKCEQRKAELQDEATAEHTSPLCKEMETRHLRIRVHLNTENVCNSSKSNQALTQNMYPLSNQALRTSDIDAASPEESNTL